MPNSKHRKKQQATNRRQLERARRKLQLQNARESDKENFGELITSPGTSSSVDVDQRSSEGDPGWLGNLYSWCHSGIVQSVEVAKDVVFPTRVLKRQLEDANERLRQMEDELRTMKESESDRKRQKIEDYAETPPLPVSGPPPPPPPPPPPIPPPPPPVFAPSKRQIMTRSKTAKLEKVGKELPAITLDDIKKVKLKSTSNKDSKRQVAAESDTCSGGDGGGFVVSLADLKNVSLRKTKGNGVAARRKSFHCSKDFHQSPPEFCRMKLKRLNHNRSPGGTVVKNRGLEDEFGEGPTPMLTRALRRKFQVACPISPLRSSSPSPVTSPANNVAPSPSFPLPTTPLGALPPFSPLS